MKNNKKWISFLLSFTLLGSMVAYTSCVGGVDSSVSSSVSSEQSSSSSSSSSSSHSSSLSEQDSSVTNEPKENSIAWYLQNGYSTLFGDPYMQNGIRVITDHDSPYYDKTYRDYRLLESNTNQAPSWQFAQWHTKYDLTDHESYKLVNGGKGLQLASKGKKTASGNYLQAKKLHLDTTNPSIYMELNAEVEFDKPKEDGEGWPHTLLSQDFSGDLVHVSSQTEIINYMDFTITHLEDKMNGQANPNKHCAQFVWYVTLQNRTIRETANGREYDDGYGQYIWFGFNLWDNRNVGKIAHEYAAQDLGKEDATLAFIYQPSSTKFYPNGGLVPRVGERREMKFDILTTAKYAFNLAKQRGYLPQTEWEDIYIGSMNFGFEVTGIYNVGVQIDTVGIYYK